MEWKFLAAGRLWEIPFPNTSDKANCKVLWALANHVRTCPKSSLSVREIAASQCFRAGATARFCPAGSGEGSQRLRSRKLTWWFVLLALSLDTSICSSFQLCVPGDVAIGECSQSAALVPSMSCSHLCPLTNGTCSATRLPLRGICYLSLF